MTSSYFGAEKYPVVIADLLGLIPKPRYLRPPKPDITVPATPRCLYCQKSDGPFTAPEHIIPEGLGNKNLVLDPGVTCDPCNHGRLSVLDNEFLNFAPVAMMRTLRGVPTKAGNLPKGRFGNATLTRTDASTVVMESNSRKSARPTPGGVQLQLIGRKMTGAYTAQLVRFMFKAALGCIYLDLGRAVAFSPKFDEVRHIILGAPFHGYLAMEKNSTPHHSVRITHWEIEEGGKPTVRVWAEVFGVTVTTDLFIRRTDAFRTNRQLLNLAEF
jgi:HNH endonuclease